MTVQLIQFFTFIIITAKFLSKYCIKRVLDTEMNGYQVYHFLTYCVHRITTKNVKFSLWSIIGNFPKGRCIWLFWGGAKILRGDAIYVIKNVCVNSLRVTKACAYSSLFIPTILHVSQYFDKHRSTLTFVPPHPPLPPPSPPKKCIWLYKLS
jgi:hypothetical protein